MHMREHMGKGRREASGSPAGSFDEAENLVFKDCVGQEGHKVSVAQGTFNSALFTLLIYFDF